MLRKLFGPIAAIMLAAFSMSAAAQDSSDRQHDLRDRNPGYQFDYDHARYLVDVLYAGALFRQPDPQGGYNAINHIMRYGYQGLLQIAQGIGASPEFRQVVWQRGSDAVVWNLYQTWLFRQPDQQGYHGWVYRLNRGDYANSIRDFVGSQEFYQKNVAPF